MTFRRTITIMTAVALAGALALAGVAGASVAAKSLSEKQWRAKVNSLCTQSDAKLTVAANAAFATVPQDQQPSIEQMAGFVTAVEPIVQARIDAIDALSEPARLKAKVKKLLKTAQGELDALVADPNRGFDGNPFTATELASKKLKLQACA